ncbi:MAG TPA: tetratricopeptide repeat protein [Pyrinomonadaceae bacterium]|nr:tetratricopeptide repeat protein [Pyrinomonadaceae bacterium]
MFRAFILSGLLLQAFVARAQQPEEPGAAWQVTRYEVTVNAGEAEGAARALTARVRIEARNVGAGAGRTFTARLNPAAAVESASANGGPARPAKYPENRTQLQLARLTLPAPVPPGGALTVSFDYRLPVADNSGLAAISPEGVQFLPLSFWYPTPNSPVAQRGADYAPFRLTVNGLAAGDAVVSSGRAAGANTFEQSLNAQPFFLTGRWEAVEGAGEARGVTALVRAGAGADERRQAEALVNLAAAARAFYAGMLGPAPDSPVRLVGVRRGAGFDMAGTVLLDHAAFRRPKVDSVTAVQVADGVARLWVGASVPVAGEGAGAVREGLTRFLSTLFLEKQFGKEAADAERLRMALLYAPVARRDAPLAQLTPAYETYFNSVVNKGALAWRLVMNAVGREAFAAALRAEFSQGEGRGASLAGLRARLVEAGGDRASNAIAALFDQPTDTDLLVGLPQPKAGGWASNLRNTGSFDVEVTVQATTDRGERVSATARIPAKDFGEAQFKTASKIVRVEVDPEKLYPQLDYANDIVPAAPGPEEAIEQARIQLAQAPAKAEALAREALVRFPSRVEARVVLARALLEQNRLDEAEREFRSALGAPLPTPATLAWAHVGLGEVAQRRGRAAEAARLFDAAVRIDAEYASTLAARAARLRAEAAAGAPPAPDEQIKAAAQRLDAAVLSGRKAEIDALIVAGELARFSKGVIGQAPEVWQTRVLRTEELATGLVAADVTLNIRALGREMAGPAVFVFARTPAGWKLSDVQFFEVR